MAISKAKKQQLVAHYRELLQRSSGLVFASYSGLTVKEMQSLRKKIREVDGEFHVVKNSLMRLAMKEEGLKMPDEVFTGTTAVGFATEDLPGVARAIAELAKDNPAVQLKAGLVEGVVYDGAQITRIAELPPLPILRAQLLAQIQAPARSVASALASSVRQVVNVFNAYAEAGAAPEAA